MFTSVEVETGVMGWREVDNDDVKNVGQVHRYAITDKTDNHLMTALLRLSDPQWLAPALVNATLVIRGSVDQRICGYY